MKILEPSAARVEPRCPFARKCGGCQIQEMSYGQQLAFKEKKVRGNLERIGGFAPDILDRVMDPVLGMDEPFGYRNKAQFPFGTDKEGRPVTGFYAGRTHDIIANTDCALGAPVNQEILEIILAFMKEYGIPAYDEKTGQGLLRHVLIRYGFTTKEIMVCLVVNGSRIPRAEELIRRLRGIDGDDQHFLSPNTRQTNVIMGDSYQVLWGQGYITDYIGDVRYQISPLSFYQVNPVQTEKLYSLALEYAGLRGGETVWDLYCGIGRSPSSSRRRQDRYTAWRSCPRRSRMRRKTPGSTGSPMRNSLSGKRKRYCRSIMRGTPGARRGVCPRGCDRGGSAAEGLR